MQPGGVMVENDAFGDGPGDRTVVERRDPRLGTVIDDRYQLDFCIAEGGFGAIYCATVLSTGRAIALKVLHANLATDPRVVARFKREAAALTKLCDPHTVRAYALGESRDGTLYIAMELLEGESLYERSHARGPLPWREVAAIACGVCSSLAEAHALGIIHRDLKPSNIHLEPRAGGDFVKVLDFGIAKILESSDLDYQEITSAGQTIGTFDYMSPEQIVGGRCTNRSDIYTLGVVMYELLGGRRPYADTTNPAAMLNAILAAPPPPVSLIAEVPVALEQLVGACLERDPQHRPENVNAIATVLSRLLATEPLAPPDRASKTPIDWAEPVPPLAPAASAPSAKSDARGSEPMLRLPKPHPVPGFRGWQPMVDLAAYASPPLAPEAPPVTATLLAEGSVAGAAGAKKKVAIGVRPDPDAPAPSSGLEAGVRFDSIPDRGKGARIAARMAAASPPIADMIDELVDATSNTDAATTISMELDDPRVAGAASTRDAAGAGTTGTGAGSSARGGANSLARGDASSTARGGAGSTARGVTGSNSGTTGSAGSGAAAAGSGFLGGGTVARVGEPLWARLAMGAAAVAAAAAIAQCI